MVLFLDAENELKFKDTTVTIRNTSISPWNRSGTHSNFNIIRTFSILVLKLGEFI